MKNFSFIICTVLVSCLGILFISPFAHALLYDFEDKAQEKDWNITDGQGGIKGGVFEIQGATEGKASMGDTNWTDYTITCKVKFLDDSNDNAGIIYRVKDTLNYYIYAFRLDQRFVWAGRITGNWIQFGAGMEVPFSTKKNQVYELKVEVNGDDTTAYVDGKETLAFSHKQLQKNEMLDKGAVGTRVWSSHAAFDDFEVNGPGIKRSGAAISPAGKLAIIWGCLK
jgi:hypothetical protein